MISSMMKHAYPFTVHSILKGEPWGETTHTAVNQIGQQHVLSRIFFLVEGKKAEKTYITV